MSSIENMALAFQDIISSENPKINWLEEELIKSNFLRKLLKICQVIAQKLMTAYLSAGIA